MTKKKRMPLPPSAFRHIMSGLMVLTALLHLGVALLGDVGKLQTPLIVFGLAFAGLGAYVRAGGRTAVLLSMLIAALGLGLGGADFVQHGGPAALPLMFLIDILILAAGGAYLVKAAKTAKT